MGNPLREARALGHSIWYDSLRRGLVTSGELQAMVAEGLGGITSNPSTFEKAIAGSVDYDEAIRGLVRDCVSDAKAAYEALAVDDIRAAADILRPLYLETDRRDGYVSLEVSPHVAHDAEATVAEARHLFRAVDRENVMIKVPGTPEGIAATSRLLAEGININVTLLFSLAAYHAVAQAYMTGLEGLVASGGDLRRIASVASFFLSRVDTVVDERLATAAQNTLDPDRRARLEGLQGRVAIANAKLAYAHYRRTIADPRWRALAARGAATQRLLWASTGTKNPAYPKLMYVEELIGPDTVDTMPPETYQEFRKHGRVRLTLTEGLTDAERIMDELQDLGIPFDELTDELLAEGLALFERSFDKLLAAIEDNRRTLLGRLAKETYTLGPYDCAVRPAFEDWRATGKVRRLWQGDTTLWTGDGEDRWLGWLHLVDREREGVETIARFAHEVREAGFRHVLLLGMGGSSLWPSVLAQTFRPEDGAPELVVLDSIIPGQLRAVEQRLDLARTLIVVSSKSGETVETLALMRYFVERVRAVVPPSPESASETSEKRFVAITDPGTPLERAAQTARWRHVFVGPPDVGGRYSALSSYGLVPAALMGLDAAAILERAEVMVRACESCCPPEVNPGVSLGLILGALARQGRDKITFLAGRPLEPFGGWLEQLVAESTGKQGRGLVPVDGERLGPPSVYGADRVFVRLALASDRDDEAEARLGALERAGHPVVRIALAEPIDLAQEVFRWQMATAVAGSVLGVNPFDQPDVEAAKESARRALSAGRRDEEAGAWEPRLRAHLAALRSGDYFALQAFVAMTPQTHAELQAIRHLVRDRRRVATTLGYGPRYLHATGQLHKGGPPTGLFLQVTADEPQDLPIPNMPYTFGLLASAQARGDRDVLAARGRRVLHVHLGADVPGGLVRLRERVARALGQEAGGESHASLR